MSPAPFLARSRLSGDALAVGSGFFLCMAVTTVVSFLANRHFVEAAVTQPVEFNHRLHVEDEGLECADCHAGFENETESGFPTPAMCSLCHVDAQGEGAEEAKLVGLLEEGSPLEWHSLFQQPPHVFFSHRRHVTVAGLECVTCHGDIGASERPPRERRPLSMDTCIGCHRAEGASDDCSSCHR